MGPASRSVLEICRSEHLGAYGARDASNHGQIINIHQVLYMPSILFTKVAILLQLQDIFVHGQRNVRWYTLQGLIILNSIFFTILLFLEIFECVPRRKIWDPTVEGRCINIEKTFVATGVINVLDDFIILILPLYWVWQLKISTRKRAAICLVFAAGLLLVREIIVVNVYSLTSHSACIASVMRLLYSIFSIGSVDITYKLMPVALWALVYLYPFALDLHSHPNRTAEVSSGLVVCCLPVLPRLFKGKKVIPGSNGTYDSGRTFTSYKKGSSRRYREVDDISLGQVPLNYTTVEAQQSRDHDVSAAKGERDFMESLPKPAILQTVSIDQESNARSPTG